MNFAVAFLLSAVVPSISPSIDAHSNTTTLINLSRSVSENNPAIIERRLVPRADLERKPAFHDQKESFKHALDQINKTLGALVSLINETHVDFASFRAGSEAYEAAYVELQETAQGIAYNRDVLRKRLELLEVIFNTMSECSKFDSVCDAGGDWLDCSLADLYELRLTFTYFSNVVADQEVSLDDEKIAGAHADLRRVERTGRNLHAEFAEKWRKFDSAVAASKWYLQSLADRDLAWIRGGTSNGWAWSGVS